MGWSDAGGTRGGSGGFLLGVGLVLAGVWLVLRNILVTSGFSWGLGLPLGAGPAIPSGAFLLAALVGFVLIFRRASSPLGWIVLGGAILSLVALVLANLHFLLRPMSLWDLLLIVGCLGAGLGLLIRSVLPQSD